MSSKDQIINELVLENGRLKAEAGRAVEPCRTCQRLRRHDCYTLCECPYLGIVDPDGPGCQKYKGGKHGEKSFEENA